MASLLMTLYRMRCDLDILWLQLIFFVEKRILNSMFVSKKLQYCFKFLLLSGAFADRYHIFVVIFRYVDGS